MSEIKYSYNKKTLSYERAGIGWGTIIFTGVSLVVFGAIFFIGLIYIQDTFFESELQAKLRLENEALKKHKDLIDSELTEANESLTALYQKEADLHRKVFLTEKPVEIVKKDNSVDILRYKLDDFKELTSILRSKASKTLTKSAVLNYQNSKLFWPTKEDVSELQYYPTKTPIKNFNEKSLASGFGNQINPFNKRMYRHNGIDIVCERGTEVIATGKGKVVAAVVDETPGGKGSYIVIEHANGYQTRYSHLSFITVQFGQKVKQGQTIGMVGSSGSSIAPHLHYEIIKNGSVINPILFFVEDLSESELYQLAQLNNQVKQSLD